MTTYLDIQSTFDEYKKKAGAAIYVACFGKTFLDAAKEEYALAKHLGEQLVQHGFGVLHGGYSGAMEAISIGANKAIQENVRKNPYWNIGVPVALIDKELPRSSTTNLPVAEEMIHRLQALTHLPDACIVLPSGGYGTLLETLEIYHMNQLAEKFGGKVRPIIFIGGKWKELFEKQEQYLDMTKQKNGHTFTHFVTTSEEAIDILKQTFDENDVEASSRTSPKSWSTIANEAPEKQRKKEQIFNPMMDILLSRIGVVEKGAKKVFDYGCGWGEFAQELVHKGFSVDAFDRSDEMVAQASRKYSGPRFLMRSEFEANKKDFKGVYDLVTSNLVVCILEREQQIALIREVSELVKDYGRIIISMCHPCFDIEPESEVSIRRGIKEKRYSDEFHYEKTIKENGICFSDIHRPLSYYVRLFNEQGLQIVDMAESETSHVSSHPDFIAFMLMKRV